MSRLETSLTKLLDIEHPILLAPMGSNSGGAMALSAVGMVTGRRWKRRSRRRVTAVSGLASLLGLLPTSRASSVRRWSAAQRRCFSHSATTHLT